jgi:hypothetical protein
LARHSGLCPLCPENGQIAVSLGISALCHKRTFALQQIFLFDHLVGASEQRWWNRETYALAPWWPQYLKIKPNRKCT